MKRHEVNQWFTQHVAQVIAEGFTPCMDELTGSYSNVLGHQMVFAKGNERVIMWMTLMYGYGIELDEIVCSVARIALAKGETLDSHYRWSGDWEEHEAASASFYRVACDWYVTTRAEANEVGIKRVRRRRATTNNEYAEIKVNGHVLKSVHKIAGFKRVKACDLRVLRRAKGGYIVRNERTATTRKFGF